MSTHKSHKTRHSDSSLFDEVCVNCQATDGNGDTRLTEPCPEARHHPTTKGRRAMLNLPKFLFINGPPGSGKSTLAKMLCDSDPSVWRESFAEPIHQMMYAVFFPEQGPIHYSLDLRDGEVKKRPMPLGREDDGSMTIRSAMISFSEDWIDRKSVV